LNSDKQRILELFLTQEHVLVAMYDKLFPKALKGGRSSMNGSSIMGVHSAMNTTVDIGVLEHQRDILDVVGKEDSLNGLNLSQFSGNPNTIEFTKDNSNIPELLIRQKKKLPEHLVGRKKNDDLIGVPYVESQKKINELLNDSALYNEIKYSTRNIIMNPNGTGPVKRQEIRSSEGKRFKL